MNKSKLLRNCFTAMSLIFFKYLTLCSKCIYVLRANADTYITYIQIHVDSTLIHVSHKQQFFENKLNNLSMFLY